jgi:hypothetical protein
LERFKLQVSIEFFKRLILGEIEKELMMESQNQIHQDPHSQTMLNNFNCLREPLEQESKMDHLIYTVKNKGRLNNGKKV